jgi:UDP-N-acetylmuramoyl-L-alanyl-D-glutamate--2,6-diaminopimelate ligase
VTPGSLYISISGFKVHGDLFVKQAVDNGACAVVSENALPACGVPWAQVASTRPLSGILSRLVYNIDLSTMTKIGITGTNGKTTTAHLFKTLLALSDTDDDVWMFGTIRYYALGKSEAAHNTTPEALEIFRDMHTAARKPKSLVMEVSSHSLALDRVAGLEYDCAVFTNLTQDHLDFHETMEEYYAAKKRLFTEYRTKNGKAVVNIDDPYGKRLAQELGRKNTVTFGKEESADVRIISWECDWDSTAIEVSVSGTPYNFSSKLAGFFNVYNMTTLVAGAYALGISMGNVDKCLSTITTVPGRMERVPLAAEFSAFVDYAHTPDALENVLVTARKLTRGRLICVFGCGGDRDRTKRPRMAEAVSHHADEAIITSDNPRSEEPQAIINDIMAGIPLDFPHQVVVDRRDAIRKAVSLARAKDCIIIAGKGHEDYQEVKGVRHHFDDREEVALAFTETRKS